MRWRAFYADGSTFGSDDGTWAQAPGDGCLILKLWPAAGEPRMFSGHDAIYWDGEADEAGQLDLPTEGFRALAQAEADGGRLKFGVLVEPERYEEIWTEAIEAEG